MTFQSFYTQSYPVLSPKKYRRFISYSKEKEDFILWCASGFKTDGFYVDVGAAEPDYESVTKTLYQMGWRGINIEPRPDIAEKLRIARPRDITINAGCGASNSEMKLVLCGGLSSCSEDSIKLLKESRSDLQTINTIIKPFREILNQKLPPSVSIDFCKIDVEGLEGSVLSGVDFSVNRPKIFCIESTVPMTDIPNHQQWEFLLTDNGYILAYVYGINRYYVDTKADDFNKLLSNFINIAYRELDIKIVDMYRGSVMAYLRRKKVIKKLIQNNLLRRLCGKRPL